MLTDLDEALGSALVVNRACHTDGLMGRAKMRIAADLHRDVASQAAKKLEILRSGGL